MQFPLKDVAPDFDELAGVLRGSKKPRKVHFVEISIDSEVIEYIVENMMNEKFLYAEAEKMRREKLISFKSGGIVTPLTKEVEKIYCKQCISFYRQMGYDYFPDTSQARYLSGMIMPKVRRTKDTALLPRRGGYRDAIATQAGYREWAEEGTGVISSWEDV